MQSQDQASRLELTAPAAPWSYYRATSQPWIASDPASAISTRVVVVGAGFAGLNTALGLIERGCRDVVVLDAHEVGFGASGRNGGFVFAGFSLGESALLSKLGPERAKAWYLRTVQAVNQIRQRIQANDMDCDLIDAGVLWANRFQSDAVLQKRAALLSQYFDTHWRMVQKTDLRESLDTQAYSGALFESNACAIHPLKYAQGLADLIVSQGGQVFQHQRVMQVEKQSASFLVRTPDTQIACEHVVIACGGYLGNLQPKLARALMPIATYVMCTEPLNEAQQALIRTRASVYDTRFAFDYYRMLRDQRLLWGGRISAFDAKPAAVETMLRRDLARVFPALASVKIDYAWSGLMSYARHEMPQIGQLEPGLWYAQAFGGHGVAPTAVAGDVIAAAIAEGDLRYQELAQFGLQRTFGWLGKMAAQTTYSWLQAHDALGLALRR